MNRASLSHFCLVLAALLAGCGQAERPTDATTANFEHAVRSYLAVRGDLCINRSSWPVVVTNEEFAQGSRNSVQLPVLEKLGLVRSSVVDAVAGDEDAKHPTRARRYELTEAGKPYYLAHAPYRRAPEHARADHDFCAAKLTLKHIEGWTPPTSTQPGAQTIVSYTYDVAPAPWTADSDARKVFPMVDRVLRGAGTMKLQEPMVLTAEGWEAKDL